MKKLLVFIKSIYILLFFAPFLLFTCGGPKHLEQSEASDTLQVAKNDSVQSAPKPENQIEYKSPLKNLWDHMITPTENSFSAFGINVFAILGIFEDNKWTLVSLMPLGFLLSLLALILLIRKYKSRQQLILSIIVLLCILPTAYLYWKDLLWGSYFLLTIGLMEIGLNVFVYKKGIPSNQVDSDIR